MINIRNIQKIVKKMLPKYGENIRPLTVLIEGNIGSGKTTFLNHFKKNPEFCLLTEPVEKWRNCGGFNLLDLMYKQPSKWAMPFQTYVTLTMLEAHTYETDKSVKLMERSFFSSRYCFVEIMRKNKTIEEGMYNILQEWYAFIDKAIHIQADLIIYLRSTPEIVYERIRQRAREEESCVPLEYLKQLHQQHEDWLIHRKFGKDIPVIVLNANLDLNSIVVEYVKSEDHIMKAVAATSSSSTTAKVRN